MVQFGTYEVYINLLKHFTLSVWGFSAFCVSLILGVTFTFNQKQTDVTFFIL